MSVPTKVQEEFQKELDSYGEELLKELESHAKKKKTKKADRYVKNFTSFAKGGDDALQLVSSLNASRLAVWGFTAEADVLGVERYRLTAVLDGRTSAFCRAVNGKTFEVESARTKINQVLSVQDPEDLRTVQPWPGQSKEEVAAYASMSGDELAALGLNIPPFHPGCRTLLVGVDDAVSSPSPRLEKPEDVGATDTMATREMFDEIGVEMTDAEIDHWNAYIRQDPVSVLADLVGETPQQLMDGDLKGKSVSVSSNGDVTLTAKGVLDDGKYDLTAIVDPYAGTVYLTQADFVAGDSQAAEEFLRTLYASLISTGQKIGADALAVNSGEDAYTYAKLGFVPNALDWQHVRADILDALDGPQKELLSQLDDDQQAFLLNLLSNNNESAFQVLADLPWEINGEPIGKVLLDLKGVTLRLDLSDAEAVARAEAYLAP